MTQYQTICLCMIVKNEAQVIKRCIDSVRPLITHWVIVDTGSTDGTQDRIREYLSDLPGELHERPWKDFAHNRSEALAFARPLADYSLIIDADDTLERPAGFTLGPLVADCYTMDIRDPPQVYPRIQLVNNRLNWRYRGVLHEFVTADQEHSTGHLAITMRRNHDGARRKEPAWFKRDAEVLERALKHEKDAFLRTRYTFYLAQSYRDGGEPEQALRCYLERATLGGWIEEVYFSLYQAAKLKEVLQHPEQDIIAAYESATNALPVRVEAAYAASRFCRVKGLYRQGYDIAKRSLGKPLPKGCLFGEPWVYETGLLDEFAVNAYWSGHHDESLDASLNLLSTGRLEGGDLQRVINNAREAWAIVSKLNGYPRPVLPGTAGENSERLRLNIAAVAKRIAVITPYYKEDTAVLRQCHESVLAQEGLITHFMIADGHANREVDGWNARHVVLPDAHGDNGNTPRGIGSLLAEAEGYDFITYLDADNWYHPDHLISLQELYWTSRADACCSMRSFHDLNGALLHGVRDPDEDQMLHVDTSCFLINRTGFRVIDTWMRMPRRLAPICDRIFFAAVRERGLVTAFSLRQTVAFRSQYRIHYVSAGVLPPPGAKDGTGVAEHEWLSTREGIKETVKQLGFYP